jgi:hypothetical protein
MIDAPAPNPTAVVVTDRPGAPQEGSTLQVPGRDTPNIVVSLMTPLAQILVRGLRTYLQSLVGLLLVMLAAPATGIVGPTDPRTFADTLQLAAGLALAPAVVSVLQNFAELLGQWDAKFPRLRA